MSTKFLVCGGGILGLGRGGGGAGGQTRVDLATLAFSPCFTGVLGPVNGINLIKTL